MGTPTLNPSEFFVHIVEFPSGADLLSDRTEGKALTSALSLTGVRFAYSLTVDLVSFEQALGARLQAAREKFQAPPILHLSGHGTREGLWLTSGEKVGWSDLAARVAPINDSLGGQLILCLSACHGLHSSHTLIGSTHSNLAAVCRVVIGNNDDVPWSDALVAFISFYHVLRKCGDMAEAISAMKVGSKNTSFFGVVKSKDEPLVLRRQN
jgi:hypothetical protein